MLNNPAMWRTRMIEPNLDRDEHVPDYWLEAIDQGREPRVPFWDGANSTIATLCAVESLGRGHDEPVPHISPDREWVIPG